MRELSGSNAVTCGRYVESQKLDHRNVSASGTRGSRLVILIMIRFRRNRYSIYLPAVSWRRFCTLESGRWVMLAKTRMAPAELGNRIAPTPELQNWR